MGYLQKAHVPGGPGGLHSELLTGDFPGMWNNWVGVNISAAIRVTLNQKEERRVYLCR